MNINYLYKTEFHVKTDKTEEFEKGFSKIVEVLLKHEKGHKNALKIERNLFGDEKDVVTMSIIMDKLEKMDGWMHMPEMVMDYYGEEEGVEYLNQYLSGIDSYRTMITKEYSLMGEE
ncbi:MAG: hypothetical protein E7214_14100 [Clostridium sp.]|nr:hypothetical protein [Clostridium sp.]